MFRISTLLRGVALAGALALISMPSAASAHGGGKFGCSFGNYGCYSSYCYSSCYSPCYSSCYYPLLYNQCYTPCLRSYAVQQPLVVQQPYVQTFQAPYVASYGGCKVFIHKK